MEQKLSCYITDDEHLAREILEAYVARVPFLELKGSFASATEAAAQIDQDMPDLLLLDVNMPGLNGLSFISMLRRKPMIILTTAYNEYALKAFDLEVKDYLLKPIAFERFYKAVLRCREELNIQQKALQNHTTDEAEYIFLKVGFRIQKVQVSDILFAEGMKDYIRVQTVKEKIMTLLNFAQLEQLLPVRKFARVHRSFVVAVDKIEHIEKNRISIGQHIIPISDGYAGAFYKKLSIANGRY